MHAPDRHERKKYVQKTPMAPHKSGNIGVSYVQGGTVFHYV